MSAVKINPYMFPVELPEDSWFTEDDFNQACIPGMRPYLPDFYLLNGELVLTYWHAVKAYRHVLVKMYRNRAGCTHAEAKDWVEGYLHFRNMNIEKALMFLLAAFPPYYQGEEGFPKQRPFRMVRARSSEIPHLFGKKF